MEIEIVLKKKPKKFDQKGFIKYANKLKEIGIDPLEVLKEIHEQIIKRAPDRSE